MRLRSFRSPRLFRSFRSFLLLRWLRSPRSLRSLRSFLEPRSLRSPPLASVFSSLLEEPPSRRRRSLRSRMLSPERRLESPSCAFGSLPPSLESASFASPWAAGCSSDFFCRRPLDLDTVASPDDLSSADLAPRFRVVFLDSASDEDDLALPGCAACSSKMLYTRSCFFSLSVRAMPSFPAISRNSATFLPFNSMMSNILVR